MGTKPDYMVRRAKETGEKKWIDNGIAYTSEKGFMTVHLFALSLHDKRFDPS